MLFFMVGEASSSLEVHNRCAPELSEFFYLWELAVAPVLLDDSLIWVNNRGIKKKKEINLPAFIMFLAPLLNHHHNSSSESLCPQGSSSSV